MPDDVHARLPARADEHGQSLQQHLAGELRRLVERPSMEKALARIATRRGGRVGIEQAVQDLLQIVTVGDRRRIDAHAPNSIETTVRAETSYR